MTKTIDSWQLGHSERTRCTQGRNAAQSNGFLTHLPHAWDGGHKLVSVGEEPRRMPCEAHAIGCAGANQVTRLGAQRHLQATVSQSAPRRHDMQINYICDGRRSRSEFRDRREVNNLLEQTPPINGCGRISRRSQLRPPIANRRPPHHPSQERWSRHGLAQPARFHPPSIGISAPVT